MGGQKKNDTEITFQTLSRYIRFALGIAEIAGWTRGAISIGFQACGVGIRGHFARFWVRRLRRTVRSGRTDDLQPE